MCMYEHRMEVARRHTSTCHLAADKVDVGPPSLFETARLILRPGTMGRFYRQNHIYYIICNLEALSPRRVILSVASRRAKV
jgi:hypothetical protein